MPTRNVLLKAAVVTAALVAVGGCGQPSDAARQNRRLADGLLTAVTTKNVKQLDRCKGLIDQRRAEGVLSASYHKRLGDIFAEARAGKWSEAEDALYRFRESVPFPD
jgi:hypothetical protein